MKKTRGRKSRFRVPLKNPPFLPDLDQATFLLFPKIKNKLTGISIIQESLKFTWEGVVRFLKKDYITKVFQRRQERFEKWICICSSYILIKVTKHIFFVNLTVFVQFVLCDLFWISPHILLFPIQKEIQEEHNCNRTKTRNV
jgi:hypothetical protein